MKIDLSFAKPAKTKNGMVCDAAIFITSEALNYPNEIEFAGDKGLLEKAAKLSDFKGASGTSFNFIAAPDAPFGKVIVIGIGEVSAMSQTDWLHLGGRLCAALGDSQKANIYLNESDANISDTAIAQIAMGIKLRAYHFERHKTKTKKKTTHDVKKIKIVSDNATAAKKAFADQSAIADGVCLARDLVNEPANILGPVEFANEAKKLEKLGVEVEVLTEKQMKKLGMDALLGVALGSERPPLLAIMRWNGGKAKDQPIAFVGKGVVFDTGGISIKPSGGMEDMKGDMGGAAAVIGLMKALAGRKAKANVIGILGLVENMPDGKAQRPGDVVTSMSGQTIEIINTDAEGRLVLCDALWYCQDRFKPKFMINLATLTGAVLVALGRSHAGLFSNNNELADRIFEAGQTTRERVWRLPLDSEYDKIIDSKFADVKNSGGRYAGSITAAQFLQRFVNDVPWAHIDVAGTAMASPKDDISTGWASGFGVRLLNELVANHYED